MTYAELIEELSLLDDDDLQTDVTFCNSNLELFKITDLFFCDDLNLQDILANQPILMEVGK